jgi:hypothetical protein
MRWLAIKIGKWLYFWVKLIDAIVGILTLGLVYGHLSSRWLEFLWENLI